MRKVIFVVGMHRSGTSAVSGALRFCNFEHGNALMPTQPDNTSGFFEQLPIVQLNNRILAMVGARWDRIPLTLNFPSLVPHTIATSISEVALEAASVAWDTAFEGTTGNLVCKDPRLALTLPLWMKTAQAKGFASEVLLVHREAVEIVGSLERRNEMSFAAAAELVTDYWIEMLSDVPANARVVSYRPFTAAPHTTLAALGYPVSSDAASAEMRRFVKAASPASTMPKGMVPAPLQAMDELFQAAHGQPWSPEGINWKATRRERNNCKTYAGRTYLLGPLSAPNFGRNLRERKVVLHCHIFKNAGSSVDVLLKEHFGPRWVTQEFSVRNGVSNADLTNTFIRANGGFDALSTHTGDWWLGHNGDGLTVMPIIFLRHPLLRIRSAYGFERKQKADTAGAKLAKSLDFGGYVRARLDISNDFAFRNFQARRLATYHKRVTADLRSSALRGLDKAPFVGLVDDFHGSAQRLEAYLAPHFDGFRGYETRTNVTDTSDDSIAHKLAAIRAELGDSLHDELLEANTIDLEIYEKASARFARELTLPAAAGVSTADAQFGAA